MSEPRTPPEPPQRRRATALRYEGEGAPRVVAAGQGHVADRIIAEAEAAGVPLRHDVALSNALATIELGQQIPEELFMAVAEVLAWAYRLDGLVSDRNRRRVETASRPRPASSAPAPGGPLLR